MDTGLMDNKSRRWVLFRLLASYYGKLVTPDFLRNPGPLLPGTDRVHPLIEGIYKPAWTDFVTSIASMLKSPYADELNHDGGGHWWLRYSPKAGGMDKAVNVALLNNMRAHEPILVLKQESSKSSRHGARYRVLGLGLVEKFDPVEGLFTVRSVELSTLEAVCAALPEEERLAAALRTEVVLPFAMFEESNREVYHVSREKRDAAFSKVVLGEYSYTCAVSQEKFRSARHVEAQAAHIVPKKERGSDDPRNGISLSHTLHWAFDVGLFTVSDQYEVVVHPKAPMANGKAFPLLALDRRKLLLPSDKTFWPHPDALEWHRKEVFDKFEL